MPETGENELLQALVVDPDFHDFLRSVDQAAPDNVASHRVANAVAVICGSKPWLADVASRLLLRQVM